MKFRNNQEVQVNKDFPSLGIRKGDRLVVVSRTPAIAPCKRIPNGIREAYGLKGYEHARIPVEYLNEVV